jgi:hypothetical protein
MTYLKCKWIHSSPEYPILLYSELDENRWETRKVEIFRDQRIGFAGDGIESADTQLGAMPVPPLEEIARDPQFEPVEITKAEFERVWAKALD